LHSLLLNMFNKKQLFGLNLLCATAYFLGAYVGGLFALPPEGVSPIWPAAGIALATLLLCGKQVLPGLFLGALLAQTASFFDGTSTENLINSFIVGTVVSLAACFQAVFSAWLINRFVGQKDLLIKDAHIIRFLLLAGPFGCIVTASFGTAILSYTKAITLNDCLSNWMTWWIGDTMGVVIFTPLLFIFFGKPREVWRSRRNYVAYPLLMLLALVVVIFYYTKQQEELRLKVIFNRQTSLLENELKHELNSHTAVTQELKSFFDSSQVVTREEFHQFSKTILAQHESIQALEWIPRIFHQQRASFEQLDKQLISINELAANNKIVPAAPREVYFPITFVEPLLSNERALGFDIATKPAALQAVIKAQNTGQTTLNAKITLIQFSKKTQGLVIYSPVYAKNKSLQTPESRKQALEGFATSVFNLETEIAEVKSKIPDLQLRIKIIDGKTILYNDFGSSPAHKINDLALYKQSLLNVADQVWQIVYLPSENFMTQHQSWERWWLLCGCLLFTSLTCISLLMLTGRSLSTEELVKIRTQALHDEVSQRESRGRILHALVISKPLSDILNLIVNTIEDEDSTIFCSILLLDEDEKHLTHGAAGRLPGFYISAIDGIEIGDGVGSCGTAAFLGRRTIVTDINNHPYWKEFLSLTQQIGLAACWSEPIISSDNKVLGTFAIYYPTVKTPDAIGLKRIEEFAQLASLAIEKNRAEEKIRHLAFYDTLTQLPNRRLLNDRLAHEIACIERHKGYGALMFLDLDHFKTLNDSLGHQIGDELLIQVAARLKECVRDEDMVARLGGDEFVVLQTAVSNSYFEQASDCALSIANRIQKALYIPYSLQGYEHHVTSSIGITLFGANNKDIDALFKQADTAMYAAKNKGRNAFSFYNTEMQHHADERLTLERDLIIALNTRQFQLYYQPQYDANGIIIGVEALLRWLHPEKGLIATTSFIAACEESGLILAIGEWTLRTACQQIRDWSSLHYIAVNIGSRQFHQAGFVQQIADILAEYQLSPQSLMLELTEKAILKDSDASIAKLTELQKLGVKVAIDDFGIGYSSVAHLKSLPINQVKIDRKFIHDISDEANSTVIIEIMLMIAKQLKLDIVAEGVETAEQVRFLQKLGCNIYQGYYFSKPLDIHAFNLLLAENNP
jgi:diguanylate cyclase (GGDEF)-like protein